MALFCSENVSKELHKHLFCTERFCAHTAIWKTWLECAQCSTKNATNLNTKVKNLKRGRSIYIVKARHELYIIKLGNLIMLIKKQKFIIVTLRASQNSKQQIL